MAFEIDPRLALNRLAFGPTELALEDMRKSGTEAWFAQQLKPEAGDDCADRIKATKLHLKYSSKTPEAEVDEDRSLGVIDQPIEEHWKLLDKSVANQERMFLRTAVVGATLIRAVHSRWQLREVLVDFWHNHFNVNAAGDATVAVALPSYDREVIRAHALGNFREMLEAVAQSAAMQVYLNNRSSRGGAANENYARELFELHTLGRPAYLNALYNKWRDVPGALQGHPQGYIDQDVYEAARAFTGWTIEDGAGIGAGRRLPTTGKFTYVETFHDNYQKRLLATEFEPYQPPLADGRKVLDLVADHPATARYVCGKLCTRLVADTPDPALIAAAVKVWTEQQHKPDQVARVVEAIVRSDAFRGSASAKIKRPLELYASFARGAGIAVVPTLPLLGTLDGSGQRLFGWGPPRTRPSQRADRIIVQSLQHDAGALGAAARPGGRRVEGRCSRRRGVDRQQADAGSRGGGSAPQAARRRAVAQGHGRDRRRARPSPRSGLRDSQGRRAACPAHAGLLRHDTRLPGEVMPC